MDDSLDLDELETSTDSPAGDTDGFNIEGQEMGFEFAALKLALAGNDSSIDTNEGASGSEQVDELERMMSHLQAARGEAFVSCQRTVTDKNVLETGSGLAGAQRRKFAAREVEKIMKQL